MYFIKKTKCPIIKRHERIQLARAGNANKPTYLARITMQFVPTTQ